LTQAIASGVEVRNGLLGVAAGGVLTGLLRNINPEFQGAKFGEAQDLEKINAVMP